ncbi:TPA: isochorismatase family protein [Vibrio cholerae]|uniref:isochorismatase family protein n=1 Tax=Vibrio cholerae TaxID=666 RepID=UPI0011F394A9|nr:isochorismatase family protein [Vibrio cholerae]QEO43019.1 isochorismatase family protein [Vibrio cholerae]
MDRRKFIGGTLTGAIAAVSMASVDQSFAAQSLSNQSPNLNGHSKMANELNNPFLEMLDRNNTVILLTDHQVGLYTGIRDISIGDLKHNTVSLAKAAAILGVPVIITATMTDGMWGPVIPELINALPNVTPIVRSKINAWDDERVVRAIESTNRKQLVVAGVSLEICATYPALAAKKAGYDVRVVLDASGTFSDAKRVSGLARLAGSGIPIMDYASVAVEMLGDNNDPKAHDVYSALDMPFATLVWQVTSSAAKNN